MVPNEANKGRVMARGLWEIEEAGDLCSFILASMSLNIQPTSGII